MTSANQEIAFDPFPPTNEERDMMSAHNRLERELIRVVASDSGKVVSLVIDGQMSFPLTTGKLDTIGPLQLQAFGASLLERGMAANIDGSYPRLDIQLTESGRTYLTSTPFFLKIGARSPRGSGGGDGVLVATRNNIPEAGMIVRALVQELASGGPRRQGKLLPGVSKLLSYPLDLACSGKPIEGQKLAQRNLSRALEALDRAAIVRKTGKALYLTDSAKRKLKTGTLRLPRVLEGDLIKQKRPPKVDRLIGLGNTELVAIWKNAIRIIANPLAKASHAAAKQTIANVTAEWERRAFEMAEGRFPWPSTEAKGGNSQLSLSNVLPEGMLAFMEYRVGRVQGEPEAVRREILARIFVGAIPPVFPKRYMDDWGVKGSPERLQKMAVSIASFARNNKRRRNGDFSDAIREWEGDLDWLYRTYYVGHFRFATGWPETGI